MKQTRNEKNTSAQKPVDYYLALPYPMEVFRIPEESGGGYNASIPLLGRYAAQGDGETAAEAIADLYLHLPALLKEWQQEGIVIPEPEPAGRHPVAAPSGRLSLRLSKSLHAQVARRAQAEGISINQFIATALAQEIGSDR